MITTSRLFVAASVSLYFYLFCFVGDLIMLFPIEFIAAICHCVVYVMAANITSHGNIARTIDHNSTTNLAPRAARVHATALHAPIGGGAEEQLNGRVRFALLHCSDPACHTLSWPICPTHHCLLTIATPRGIPHSSDSKPSANRDRYGWPWCYGAPTIGALCH